MGRYCSTLFGVVEGIKLGYLTHGPTSDEFNGDAIDSQDPNISHDYLYFSAVTFFSIGHGDVLCSQLAMMTALVNNMVNVVLMAIVVSVYPNRRSTELDQTSSA